MKLLDRRFLNISFAVLGVANQPADNPSLGSQYIVGSEGTGAFSGVAPNSIARFNGSGWDFVVPKLGDLEVLNIETGQILAFNGSAWSVLSSLGSSSILPIQGIVDFFNNDGATNEHLPGQFGICWSDGAYSFCSTTFEYNSAAKNLVIPSPSIHSGQRFAAALNGKVFTISDTQTQNSVTEETLSDGDLVFNLADNSFYGFSASAHKFFKVGNNVLSVDEFVDYSVKGLTNPAQDGLAVGNSVIDWQSCSLYSISKTDNFSTADSISGEHDILIGQSYIARNDANFNAPVLIRVLSYNNSGSGRPFQHGYEGWSSYVRFSVIPDGAIIVNKADNSTYIFDAVADSFIKLTAQSSGGSANLPVLGIINSGTSLPLSPTKGELFLHTSEAKLYSATDNNVWDEGSALPDGARYASATDFKLYSVSNNSLSSENLLDGQLFFNKQDRSVYAFDASELTFIKSGGVSISETHSLSAAEAEAKSFSLAHSVAVGQESNIVCSVEGVVQLPNIDFVADGNVISWGNKGLDAVVLEEGDTFFIHYIKE